MEIDQMQKLICELRDERGMTRDQIRQQILRRVEAEAADDADDYDEVECGFDRPIAGVPLPPVDIMIDYCLGV